MADEKRKEAILYVQVLGIPQDAFPPDYFRLLGITQDVDKSEVIESAAKKQSDLLRRVRDAEFQLAARRILQRIAKARVCLSDANARAAYVASLTASGGQQDSSTTIRAKRTDPSTSNANEEELRVSRHRDRSTTNIGRRRSAGTLPEQSSLPDLPQSGDLFELDGDDLQPPGFGFPEVVESPLQLPKKKKGFDQWTVVMSIGAILLVGGLVAGIAYLSTSGSDSSVAATAPSEDSNVDQSNGPEQLPRRTSAGPEGASSPATAQEESSAIEGPANARLPNQDVPLDTASRQQDLDPNEGPAATAPEPSRTEPELPKEPPGHPAPERFIPVTTSIETEVDLPPLRAVKTATVESSSTTADIGVIAPELAANLKLRIDQPQSAGKTLPEFRIQEALPEDEDGRVWQVRMSPPNPNAEESAEASDLGRARGGDNEEIGRFYIENDTLRFAWGEPKQFVLAEQLRNTRLALTTDAADHSVQLRKTKVEYRCLFDLSQRRTLFELESEHLPPSELIRLEISNPQLQGLTYEMEPADGFISEGDTAVLRLPTDSVPIEFQIKLIATDSKISVRLTPRYKMGRRWEYFTGDDVYDALGDLQDSLANGRDELAAAERAASSLPGQIRSAAASIRDDDPYRAAKVAAVTRMERALRAANSTVRRWSKNLPEIEAKIPVIQELLSLGKRLDLQGEIEFAVTVPLQGGQLVLMRSGDETPPRETAEAIGG